MNIHFTDEKISPETLQQILDAGNRAATGGNLQPYSIIKIEDDAVRDKLADLCGQKFIAKVSSPMFTKSILACKKNVHLQVTPMNCVTFADETQK